MSGNKLRAVESASAAENKAENPDIAQPNNAAAEPLFLLNTDMAKVFTAGEIIPEPKIMIDIGNRIVNARIPMVAFKIINKINPVTLTLDASNTIEAKESLPTSFLAT